MDEMWKTDAIDCSKTIFTWKFSSAIFGMLLWKKDWIIIGRMASKKLIRIVDVTNCRIPVQRYYFCLEKNMDSF